MKLTDIKTITEQQKLELPKERRITIHGVVGVGKTNLAEAIINEHDAFVYKIDGASVTAEELEEVLSRFRFGSLLQKKRILFFDEIQKATKLIRGRLLVPMQEFRKEDIVICCSSRPYAELRYGKDEEFSALMSRLFYVVELKPSVEIIASILEEKGYSAEEAIERAKVCGGDIRSAIFGTTLVGDEYKDFADLIRNPDEVLSDTLRLNYKKNAEFAIELAKLSNITNPVHKVYAMLAVARKLGCKLKKG